MQDAWNDRLSEYLDDELGAAERSALDEHLRSCARCREDLDDLRAVVARAAALVSVPPDRELWLGVAARIGAPNVARPERETRRFSFTLPQLIAAGLALMVLSGGMVWLARLGGPQTDIPPLAADTPVRPANFADGAYDDAIADLERMLEAGRSRVDKETLRVLEDNLQAIDRAIAQCREALAADPANAYLNTYLAQARGRKLELLRTATSLANRAG